MKKVFLLSALTVLALSSCMKDTVVDMQKDEIKFSVTTDVATKAGAVATTTNTIEDFTVWGYTNGTLYLNEEVNKNGNNNWEFASTHFWPDNNNMNFYSLSPVDYLSSCEITPANDAFHITCTTNGTTDFLYSVKNGVSKLTNNGTVALNHRHGFAHLFFNAKNTNEKLGVAIEKVSVAQTYTVGELTLSGQKSTDPHMTKDDKVLTETAGGWGTWSEQKTVSTLEAQITPVILENVDTYTLTTDNKGLFVLPQELLYWDPNGEVSTYNNGYFVISCKVWNITGDPAVDSDPVYLWGDAQTYKEIAVPIVVPTFTTDSNGNQVVATSTFTWQQGTKYIYTFNFSKGAGYVPPTVPDTENPGDPVLVPIEVSITVDEFQTGNAIDPNLQTEQ